MLDGVLEYMHEQGIGEICELFDGDTPHRPGGAIASARSIAEVLRAYVEDVLELGPAALPPRPNPAPANPVRTTRYCEALPNRRKNPQWRASLEGTLQRAEF